MFPIAGQTAGPNGLTFFVDTTTTMFERKFPTKYNLVSLLNTTFSSAGCRV